MSRYDAEQLARLEPPYVARYGLAAAPFSAEHDDAFIYLDAERLQRLNMLHHLTQYSELLLIITGVKGIGKTSLLQRFINTANEELIISRVNANPMMDAHGLLKAIAEGFHLATIPDDPTALQESLYHHLADLHHREQTPVLLVDDAHALPQDALETLFNLAEAEASDGNLLRIILFSDPQIETMLESPSIQRMRERVTHTMEIPVLTEEQTVEYIRHRLSVTGLRGSLPFSPKELKKIYSNSAGIPARINECAHLILMGSNLEQAVKNFHVPNLHRFPLRNIAIVITVLVLAGLLLTFQEQFNALFEDSQTEQTKVQSPEQQSPEQQSPEQRSPEAPPHITEPSPQLDNTQEPVTEPVEEISEAPQHIEPETEDTIITTPPPPVADIEPEQSTTLPVPEIAPEPVFSIETIEPDPVSGSRQPQTIHIEGQGFTPDTEVTVAWSGNRKKLADKQFRVIDDRHLEISITVGIHADKWEVRLKDPSTSQVASRHFEVVSGETKKPATPRLNDQAWIHQQDARYFTVQLFGSHSKSSLLRFVKQHRFDSPIAFFQSRYEGRPWYVLIQGNYANKPQAIIAAKRLAQNLPGIQPWVRPYSQVQAEIKTPAVARPETIPSIIDDSPPVSQKLADNTAWLWSQDPSHFTLQLMNGINEAGVKRFVAQHDLDGRAIYYRTQRKGQTRFIVIYGNYANRDAARKAIASLPMAIQHSKPWTRAFSSIHADLNTH